MPSVDDRIRRLEHTKKHESVGSRQQPALSDMSDGDERVVLGGGNTMRLYRKEFGKLWYIEFTRT